MHICINKVCIPSPNTPMIKDVIGTFVMNKKFKIYSFYHTDNYERQGINLSPQEYIHLGGG